MRRLAWSALGLLAGLSACQPVPAAQSTGLSVVTTVNIITDLAGQIGGERVQVQGLMGAGVDPHLYKASAGDVRRLTQARVVLYGGHHLEGKLGEVLEGLVQRPGVQVSAVMEAVPEGRLLMHSGAVDPHLWFDPTLWKYAATATAEALSEADPAGRTLYQNNLQEYLRQLDDLDRWSAGQLGQIPPERRMLVTAHDAFGYFCRRYDFEVRGGAGHQHRGRGQRAGGQRPGRRDAAPADSRHLRGKHGVAPHGAGSGGGTWLDGPARR